MEWVELVLDFLKSLAWPFVVVFAVCVFKDELREKLRQLTSAETPVGSATFDQKARELEEQAEQAKDAADREEVAGTAASPSPDGDGASLSGPEPPASSDGEIARRRAEAAQALYDQFELRQALGWAADVLSPSPDFTAAREVTATSPTAAVMLAFTELERVIRAAWTVERMSPHRGQGSVRAALRDLAETSETAAGFEPVVLELAQLRNGLAHGEPDATVSAAGAIDFIDTCETISSTLARVALSKLRHPSRSQRLSIEGWEKWLQHVFSEDRQDEV